MTVQESAILEVLATLHPAMEADGGGVKLVSVCNGIVKVQFTGACMHCPSIDMTMELGITRVLKEKLSWVVEVCREGRTAPENII